MPEILLDLLEVPEVREALLDLVIWLLAQTQINPTFATDCSALMTQLRNPALTTEERQALLAKLNALHATH